MAITLDATEVLSMASHIAHNGREFYARAADVCQGAPTKGVFDMLARTWEEHEKRFAEMSTGVGGDAAFDPASQVSPAWDIELYLQSMTDTQVFDTRSLSKEEPSCDIADEAVLSKAIAFEKEAVLFFLGMEELVPERLGRDVVHDLVREEMQHVANLTRELNGVTAAQ